MLAQCRIAAAAKAFDTAKELCAIAATAEAAADAVMLAQCRIAAAAEAFDTAKELCAIAAAAEAAAEAAAAADGAAAAAAATARGFNAVMEHSFCRPFIGMDQKWF